MLTKASWFSSSGHNRSMVSGSDAVVFDQSQRLPEAARMHSVKLGMPKFKKFAMPPEYRKNTPHHDGLCHNVDGMSIGNIYTII